MQTPTTIEGLRRVLRSLGYGDALFDVEEPSSAAQTKCKQRVEDLYAEGSQTLQDEDRKNKAMSLIEQFPWNPSENETDDMLGLHANAAGYYIPRESNKTLTYYGPYETEEQAWVTDALTSPDADLSSREACEQTVRAVEADDGELAYYEDDPGSIGFRKVRVRPGDKVPIDNYFVRSGDHMRRKMNCAEVDSILEKTGGTKDGFYKWLEGPATQWLKARSLDLMAVGIQGLDDIGALLEEEQDLIPLEVDEVIEDEDGKPEAIVVEDWESDEAVEAAALSLLRN